jgi:hypothetical protein
MPVTIDEVSTEIVAPPQQSGSSPATTSQPSPQITPSVAAELALLAERTERLKAD